MFSVFYHLFVWIKGTSIQQFNIVSHPIYHCFSFKFENTLQLLYDTKWPQNLVFKIITTVLLEKRESGSTEMNSDWPEKGKYSYLLWPCSG